MAARDVPGARGISWPPSFPATFRPQCWSPFISQPNSAPGSIRMSDDQQLTSVSVSIRANCRGVLPVRRRFSRTRCAWSEYPASTAGIATGP